MFGLSDAAILRKLPYRKMMICLIEMRMFRMGNVLKSARWVLYDAPSYSFSVSRYTQTRLRPVFLAV